MEPTELINQYLLEAQRQLPSLRLARHTEPGVWVTCFEDHAVLSIEYDPALERIMITADAGTVHAHARDKVHELLLGYNAMWRQTGGTRMALDRAGGRVLLLFELGLGVLCAPRLGDALKGMAAVRQAWACILDDADGEAPGVPALSAIPNWA